MMKRALMAIAFLFAVCGPAAATETLTTQMVKTFCEDPNQDACLGVLIGSFTMAITIEHHLAIQTGQIKDYETYANRTGTDLWMFTNRLIGCPPAAMNGGQLKAVFLKWALANPEKWHLAAPFGIAEALKEAYPCN